MLWIKPDCQATPADGFSVGDHDRRLREDAAGGRSGGSDVVVTHALYPPAMLDDFTETGSIGAVLPPRSVPHLTNAIPLDGFLADALADALMRRA